jgi:hypothetical protein
MTLENSKTHLVRVLKSGAQVMLRKRIQKLKEEGNDSMGSSQLRGGNDYAMEYCKKVLEVSRAL